VGFKTETEDTVLGSAQESLVELAFVLVGNLASWLKERWE
jgi:hypothetical protein